MALTREERITIDILKKKIRTLEVQISSQDKLIEQLFRIVNRLDSRTDMSEWTSEQWRKFLRPYLATNRNTSIVKHDHTNDQNGGDSFAKLGANLINGDE